MTFKPYYDSTGNLITSGKDSEQIELEKLEQEQFKLRERRESEWHDRYNTNDKPESKHYYKKIVNARLQIAPISGENINDYIKRLKIFQTISHNTNWEKHVDNGKRTWHTHMMPDCFMCADQIFIRVTISVLQILADANPEFQF